MTVVLRVKYSGWRALDVRRSRRGSPSGCVGAVFGRSGCSASEQLLSGGQVCGTSAATGLTQSGQIEATPCQRGGKRLTDCYALCKPLQADRLLHMNKGLLVMLCSNGLLRVAAHSNAHCL